MHIGPRKVFPGIDCILTESLDGGKLGYRSIRIFIAVNKIDKVHMGACDKLAATFEVVWNGLDVETYT